MTIRSLAVCLLTLCTTSAPSLAQDKVHIWVKAFIPNDHPGNPGYVQQISGNAKHWVIAIPTGSGCFMTDNRTFSKDASASARLSAEFILSVDHGQVSVVPSTDKPLFLAGPTHKVNCTTGIDLEPAKTAATSNMHLGHPAYADGVAQVILDFRGSNPFYTVAPDIVAAADFKFDTNTKELRLTGSVGAFPAFEVYAQLNDGSIRTILQMKPGDKTDVFSLVEFGTGLKQRPVNSAVKLQ